MKCRQIPSPISTKDASPPEQDFMYDKRLQRMDDDIDVILDSIDPILLAMASKQRQQRK